MFNVTTNSCPMDSNSSFKVMVVYHLWLLYLVLFLQVPGTVSGTSSCTSTRYLYKCIEYVRVQVLVQEVLGLSRLVRHQISLCGQCSQFFFSSLKNKIFQVVQN